MTDRQGKIEEFKGSNEFLSNMYALKAPLEFEVTHQMRSGETYHGGREIVSASTVEHAYQASKFTDRECQLVVLTAMNGHFSKRNARLLQRLGANIDPFWETNKIEIMRKFVKQKFDKDPDLRQKLIDTGEVPLEEGNNWGDRYWGVTPPGSGKGENNLGKILMVLRTQYITGD